MTDLYIVSGFLGAGKTTLIQTMARNVFQGQKIVVIENDFGEAGIDASCLRSCEIMVTSINAGCICCSMSGDFYKAIGQIVKEYAPDVILVEPSGVGKLSDIIKACLRRKDLVLIRRCITVVDGNRFDKYKENYGDFFVNQIRYADLILLSHQTGDCGKIEETIGKIKEINQEARIAADFWDSIPSSVFLFGKRVEAVKELEKELVQSPKFPRILKVFSSPLGLAKEIFTSVTIECPEVLTEEQLKEKLNRVLDHGDGVILRGKGIVKGMDGGMMFHYIPGMLNVKSVSAEGTRVCFIGTGLKEQQIKSLFQGEL